MLAATLQSRKSDFQDILYFKWISDFILQYFYVVCQVRKCSESATLLSYFGKQGDETLFKAKTKFMKKVKQFYMFFQASLIFVAQWPIRNNLSVISHSRKQKKKTTDMRFFKLKIARYWSFMISRFSKLQSIFDVFQHVALSTLSALF